MNTKTSNNNMRTTHVSILVPSNNDSSSTRSDRVSEKDATVQYQLEKQIRIEAVLNRQDQLIQQLKRNLARMGQSANKLALEDLPENVKAFGTIIRQELEELPQNGHFDYNTTYKDHANKSTRDSLFAYGKIYNGQYSISDSRLKRILSEMFYNKKKELKLSIDKKEIRKIKSAVKSSKAAVNNYEGLDRLIIPSWISDEEEIVDNDVDGNLIFKVLRPSFRIQMGKLVRNSSILTEALFPSYLDKEDFHDWAFST
ncbi:uncharacterized protein BX663DRAFT_523041 [Cokeromyces recurvatus]|uniref:uncharacterized protein n=1 Tax=Cokeromyces recurvatus TaxID=90255 RepID=UPI00221F44E1|nr:uncharacterized protein BX663DRAFT_523041 [Cokeromyces recurvatus]KAI7899063.1 hypothetical protein BX663DRAFT_523041 [Cokeromyces recurvatus]